MPLDKDEVERSSEDDRPLTPVRVGWIVVFGFIATLAAAFVAGVVVKFLVEFFERGWNLIGG